MRIDIAAAEEHRRAFEILSLVPLSLGVDSSHIVPGGPIAPPLKATKPPKRDAFRIANSVVRHAPCEKPSDDDAIARHAGRFDFDTNDSNTDSADDRYGSLLAMSDMKLYGYQVRFAAAGAR